METKVGTSDNIFEYVMFEDEYLTRIALGRILSSLRPSWKMKGHCDTTHHIHGLISSSPNLIISKMILSDGSVTEILTTYQGLPPIILYSEYPMPERLNEIIPTTIEYIEKPVSHIDLLNAINRLEKNMQTESWIK